jgi:N-acetylneuraminate synthase|tara:strand:+ start:431 stop:1285 length:855 start_codon:yes stop_codon:yes gene_type:complete
MNKIFIISEIGINHNGDLKLAKQMIKESKISGADAVKFQKRDIDLVYDKKQLDSERKSPWGNKFRDQKEGLEFNFDDYKEIETYCKELNIDWFASAWDHKSLEFLSKFNLKYNKIASAMIIDKNFLELVAKQKKYTFISTGMSDFETIDQAIDIFRKYNCEFELMHCISQYPFDDKIANLNMIKVLRERYNCKVGYSGHEKGGLAISYAASALGISSLERHFTIDRSMYGSDQSASITPQTFRELIGGIRKIESAIRGDENKKILDIEIEVANKLRAHINNTIK